MITAELSMGTQGSPTDQFQPRWTTALINAVADRVLKEISRLTTEGKFEGPLRFGQRDGAIPQ